MADQAQHVELPDGTWLEVPPGVSDAEVHARIASRFPDAFTKPQGRLSQALSSLGVNSAIQNVPRPQQAVEGDNPFTTAMVNLGLKVPGIAAGMVSGSPAQVAQLAHPLEMFKRLQANMSQPIAQQLGNVAGVDSAALASAAKSGDVPGMLTESLPPIAAALIGGKIGSKIGYKSGGVLDMPPELAVEKVVNAVNPDAARMPTMRSSLADHIEAIADHAAENGMPVTDRPTLAAAAKSLGDKSHAEFRALLDPIADTTTYGGSTLGSLYKRLTQINATLYPKYNKGGGGSPAQAAINAQDAAALNAEAASIRSELYKGMGDKLGLDPEMIQALNGRAGALRDLSHDFQLSADKVLHETNAAKEGPVDLHMTLPGAVASLARKGATALRGSPADNAIAEVFQNLLPRASKLAKPTTQQPGPFPRDPFWRTNTPAGTVISVGGSTEAEMANVTSRLSNRVTANQKATTVMAEGRKTLAEALRRRK